MTDSLGSPTVLNAYRASLAGIHALPADEELVVARAWRAGDAAAGARLVNASLPFVITIAKEYRRWGIPLEDLIQQGNLGLLKAAIRFEPDRACRLVTYAAYWIRAEIRDYVVRAHRVVRFGGSKPERRVLRAWRRTREDDPARLGELARVAPEDVTAMLPMIRYREASLDAAEPGESPALDRVQDAAPLQDEAVGATRTRARWHARIEDALSQLPQRERWIVEQRVLGESDVTLESLGTRLGVSKERVRQLEARAMGRLRDSLGDLRPDLAA